jgi:hypothetical protein
MVGIGELLAAARNLMGMLIVILMRMVIRSRIDGRIEAMGERKSGAQILWRVVTSGFHSCRKGSIRSNRYGNPSTEQVRAGFVYRLDVDRCLHQCCGNLESMECDTVSSVDQKSSLYKTQWNVIIDFRGIRRALLYKNQWMRS